jgi:hypothetical protein
LLSSVGQDKHSPGHETEKAEQLRLLSLRSKKQERWFLLLQCHALPESLCSTLFATVYKSPAEGGFQAFCFFALGFWGLGFGGFWIGLWLDSFALGFLVWEALGREKNY